MDPQSQNSSPDSREKLLAYWRRRGTFWSVAGAVMGIAVAIAVLWPPTYRSTATILIEQQEIPQDLVRSVITTYADQRVQIISQRVMTSQNLLALIDRYKLYSDIRDRVPREKLLDTMRDDVNMKMISAGVIDPRSGQPTHATIAFSVSYDSRSPDLALKVANDLSSLYLNENLTSRSQRSKQTAAFFAEESARQQARIAELDQKLAEFKEKHQDELPEFVVQNVQTADRTELELHAVEDHISSLDSQRVLLQAQLAQISPTAQVYSDSGQRVYGAEDQLKSLRAKLAGLKGKYGPDHPDVISTQREIEGLQKEVNSEDTTSDRLRQLSEAKSQLAAALEKYSAEHPDVLRLRREVDSLEKEVQIEASAGGPTQTERAHADNPAYVQVKSEIDSVTLERDRDIKKRDQLQAKLNSYDKRMAQSPEVERAYREIVRDLEAAQFKYGEILSKQSEAQIAVNLETEQKGEKFTMIEAPQPPEKPVSPNRILILVIGLLLSLASGVGAVLGRETLDASVRGPKDIRELLQVPALASIPIIVTTEERARRQRITRYSWGGSVAALILAAVTVHFFILPLDVLWLGLLRRFGV
jgi:succinoglycan biosynthesis transport protein ExoP